MYKVLEKLAAMAIFSVFEISTLFAQADYTKYIDPTIGNVARFLASTYPTIHLLNQMIRMFPVKQDYISDHKHGYFPAFHFAKRKPNPKWMVLKNTSQFL